MATEVKNPETPQDLDFEPLKLDADKPLGELYYDRVKQNQDITVLIEDWHNRRGTGKTTITLRLAEAFDRTDEGLTSSKCGLQPQRVIDNYTDKPRGSSLVLDEAEAGVDKYRAGSMINKAMREVVSMGRIEQKYLVMNAPAGSQIDRDLKKLFDIIIVVHSRGRAAVYFVRGKTPSPHDDQAFFDRRMWLDWEPIGTPSYCQERLQRVYKDLAKEKQEMLEGDGQDFYASDEVHDMIQKAEEDAAQQKRNDIIRKLLDDPDMTPIQIKHGFDVSRQRISQIRDGK